MKRVRDSIKLLRFNLKSILIYEILYKVLSYAILAPFLYTIFNFSIKCSGISYLTKLTIDNYFKAPSTYAFFLLALIVLAAFTLLNISGLIYAMEASNRLEKIGPIKMLAKGVKNALRIFYYKNTVMALYVMVLLPITNSTMVSATMLGISLPDYVKNYIKGHMVILGVAFIVYVFLCIVGLLSIYSLNYFTVKKMNFVESIKESIRCVKNGSIKPVIGILFWNIIMAAITVFLSGVVSSLLMMIVNKTVTYKAAYFIIDTVVKSSTTVMYILFSIIVIPLTYAYICNSYYDVEDDILDDEDNIDNYKDYNPIKSRMRERAFVIMVILIAMVLDISYIILSKNNIISLDAEFLDRTTVTAHRGDSLNAPENTLSAFEKAIENQADVIELDVRETKDGQIVVMHDENLKRTIGVDKKVGELTYDELIKYDAGSWFSEGFTGERVPTLEEAIVLIDGRADMNIELKPAKTDVDLESKVAEIVSKYDLYDQCVVTSLDYDAIRNIKKLDENITTVYVMSVALGDFYNLKYADAFSIKYSFITTELVKKAHKKGKEVYAWTVNSDTVVNDMMLRGVDSIITDNPYHTKKIMYDNTEGLFSSLVQKYLNVSW